MQRAANLITAAIKRGQTAESAIADALRMNLISIEQADVILGAAKEVEKKVKECNLYAIPATDSVDIAYRRQFINNDDWTLRI